MTPVFDSNDDIICSLTEIHQFIYLHYKKKKKVREKDTCLLLVWKKISDVFRFFFFCMNAVIETVFVPEDKLLKRKVRKNIDKFLEKLC